ncbi:MAG: DDE-type integrase/transposase/recombinase [Saprospiraceae bacterium]|nr:DDE-type integrase/transposase/recombinase [Saprospiraceae bacterium]
MNISKQSVHQRIERNHQDLEIEAQLLWLIHQIREDHPTMGVRDLFYKIRPESMGRDRFEAFCKENSLMSLKKVFRPRTTDNTGVIRFDNLLIDLQINRVDQVWQSDITYFELNNRFYYLTFILDAYSRRIVGHNVSDNLTTICTTMPALKMAIKLRAKQKMSELIFHSDGGGQYYAKSFFRAYRKI